MIFEDFFWVAFAIGLKRGQRIKETKEQRVRIDKAVNERIASVMPFKLTRAQKKVTAQIFNDMKSTAPMNRLLTGRRRQWQNDRRCYRDDCCNGEWIYRPR